jgi:hypothetical protein
LDVFMRHLLSIPLLYPVYSEIKYRDRPHRARGHPLRPSLDDPQLGRIFTNGYLVMLEKG